jgi:CHAD domain-containing protein
MYKFDPRGEPVATAFRSIALSQIDEILGELDRADAGRAQLIHEARRRSKKLRGLLRLVRPAFSDFAKENAALRDAAALLSHLRDADVLRHTIGALAEHAGADADRLQAIAQRLDEGSSQQDEAEAKLREFNQALTAIRERAASWCIDADGPRPLIGGLRRTYASGGHRMHKAARTRAPVDLHEWRKAAKYHSHHVDLLKRAAPEVLGPELDLAERLATCLGEHHDLSVLTQAMDAQPERFGDGTDVVALRTACGAQMHLIEDEAFQLGRQVYAERPKALARRFRAYWDGAA